MALPSDYISGTITLTNGSTAFTGTGTGWLAADFREGDIILDVEGGEGAVAVIASITSNTAGVLSKEWEGPTLTGVAYRMRYQWDSGRVSAQSRAAIEMLGNGNLQSFASLAGPGVPVFDGPHSVTIKPESDFVNGVTYDVQVDTLADRDAYDGQSEGFAVLVSDVGDGRSALYSKNSNAVGDWGAPAYITGPVGPTVTIEAGTTTTLPPGSNATFDVVPVPGGYELNAGIPAGEGFVYRGDYSGVTSYVKGDVVLNNNSSWISLQATTGNAPPVLPTTSNSYWSLLARAGVNGTGTGTVVGPASAVDTHIATYDGTTGELIQDGGISLADRALTWPPISGAPFHVAVSDGTVNPHMFVGYNTLPGAVLSDPTQRGAIFGIESDYEPTPGTKWAEMYWQYNFGSGFTGDDCRRQIMAVIDKATNIPVVLQLGGGPTSGISMNIIDGTGTDQQKIVGKQKVEILPNRMTVVGNAGSTAPAFNVLSNSGSVTGIEIATGVAGYGGVVQVTSSAANEALYLRPKGSAPTVSQGTSFLIPNGSAATPSLSFENDQDTGFLRVSADVIGVTAGGQVRVSVSSAFGSSLNIEAPTDGYSNLLFREAGATKWRFYNDFTNDRLFLLDADASAGVYLDQNATSWASASDRRLPYKETGKTFSVLDKLDRFEVLEFTRPGGAQEIGVKAQDLHKAFPALVVPGADDEDRELSGMEDPGLWSIRADRAGFVALAGVKELLEQIEQLKREIAGLKSNEP